MGKRSKEPFFQRKHTGGQKAHENMFNIASYERNANQNYEVSLHTSQNGHHQKNLQAINAGDGVEKREPCYTVGGNVNWYNHYGEQLWRLLKN